MAGREQKVFIKRLGGCDEVRKTFADECDVGQVGGVGGCGVVED